MEGALRDYGVVMTAAGGEFAIDEPGTAAARARMSAGAAAEPPFFDRGPGYPRLSGGRAFADVDFR